MIVAFILGIKMSKLSMWKTYPGYYRFQTTDTIINKKMKRSEKFILTAHSTNEDLWVYEAPYGDMRLALTKFRQLCGKVAMYKTDRDVYE